MRLQYQDSADSHNNNRLSCIFINELIQSAEPRPKHPGPSFKSIDCHSCRQVMFRVCSLALIEMLMMKESMWQRTGNGRTTHYFGTKFVHIVVTICGKTIISFSPHPLCNSVKSLKAVLLFLLLIFSTIFFFSTFFSSFKCNTRYKRLTIFIMFNFLVFLF